jgi:hypothetical protein
LLTFHFGWFMVNHHANVAVDEWHTIQWSMLLFVITTVLYRQSRTTTHSTGSVTDDQTTLMSTLLLLLPDIIIDVLLLLLLLHMMVAAVVIMQLCTILLAVSAMVNSCACTIRVTTAPTSTFTLPIGHAKNERNSINCLTSIADPPVHRSPLFAVVV